jgi:hypothetical protein
VTLGLFSINPKQIILVAYAIGLFLVNYTDVSIKELIIAPSACNSDIAHPQNTQVRKSYSSGFELLNGGRVIVCTVIENVVGTFCLELSITLSS